MRSRRTVAAILAPLLLASCATEVRPPATRPAVVDAGGPPISRVAFGSCCRTDRPQPIWEAVLAGRPELFIFLGDNVYADSPDPAVVRAKYEQLAADPGYARLRASPSTRVLATWDDHDMGLNDAGVEFAAKATAKEELLRFLDEPADAPRRSRDGVYDDHTFGPAGRRVQVILLDTRWFRSPLKQVVEGKLKTYVPDEDPAKTVLGEAQWAWLDARLAEPADVRIVASSIQVLSAEHRFEKWNNFPRERGRLLAALGRAGGTSVILSGDRHTGEISIYADADPTRPILDVTASSLNTGSGSPDAVASPEPNPYRVAGDRVVQSNFGTLEIDWAASTLSVQVRDVAGVAVRAYTTPLTPKAAR